MKQFIKTTLFSLIFILAFLKSNAQNSSNTDILGAWTMNYDKTLDEIQGLGEKTYETMDVARKNRIELAYKGRVLTFFTDGTFEQKLTDGRQANGTWSITGQKLFLISAKGTEYEYGIHKITSNTLEIKTKEYGESKPIFKTWHFNKN